MTKDMTPDTATAEEWSRATIILDNDFLPLFKWRPGEFVSTAG